MIKKVVLFLFLSMSLWIAPASAEENKTNQKLIVNTSTNKMEFYQNGVFIKNFIVATGKKATPTPKGAFKIVNKIKNRPYYTGRIKGGDPRNPLGDRWIGLNMGGTYGTTYAIHGNNNEQAIGKATTLGCIRMHNEDIHWLFERINEKAVVVVK